MSEVPTVDRENAQWTPASRAVLACFLLAAGLSFGGDFALRFSPELSVWIRVVIALAPLPALAGIIAFGVRALSRMDELERRIQAEALAVAFGGIGLILVVFGQLHRAGVLGPERWTVLWPLMWAMYCAGLAWSSRRYR
jgi:hypothetical protein